MINRRRMLFGMGSALALPLLPSIMRTARADPPKAPRRFVFVFTANGQYPVNWWPTWQPSWTQHGTNVRSAPLQAPNGYITPVLGPELAPLKDKLLLLRGLDAVGLKGDGHSALWPLSGYQDQAARTIDQVLARSDKVYPSPPAVRSSHVLIKPASVAATTVSMADAGGSLQSVPAQTEVSASFQTLFGNFVEEATDPTEEQRRALKLSVLDRVRADYEQLRNSKRIGSEDKLRLQAHVEYIHDLHSRLMVPAGGGAACVKPNAPDPLDPTDDTNLPQIARDHMDVVSAAIKCDRCRVFTIMLGGEGDTRSFGSIGAPSNSDHHGLSHDGKQNYNPDAVTALGWINNHFAKQLAHLLSSLDADIEDPTDNSTYLDNTVVYWGNEDGCHSFDPHYQMSMPVLLAGGAGGYFNPGRYVDFREPGQPILYEWAGTPGNFPSSDDRGRLYNSLLVTLLQSMGLAPEDYEQPGQSGFGDYTDNYQNQYSIADGQQPLPAV